MQGKETSDIVFTHNIKTEGEGLESEETAELARAETALRSPRRAKRKYRQSAKSHEYAPLGNSVFHRAGAPSWGSIFLVCASILGVIAVIITFYFFSGGEVVKSRTPICQLQRQRNAAGEAFLNDWEEFSCQRVYKCNTQSSYLIDRTCTVEDMTSPSRAPTPRGVDVLVARDFKIIYVRNPSAVDAIVRHIMINLFSAHEMNSHVLTTPEVKEYFFFTFVQNSLGRFSLGFTEKGMELRVLNASSNCDSVNALFPVAFSENWVPSQSFFLSGDAGSMNHMIRFDWIGDASDVKNVLFLFEHIQAMMPADVCLPEINFQQLNYEFIRGRQETHEISERFQGCMDSVTHASLLSYYRQDEMCWFT